MSTFDLIALLVAGIVLLVCSPLLGRYMARVYDGQKHFMSFLGPVERFFYRILGVDANRSMSWKQYAGALGIFTLVSLVLVFLILVAQGFLPWNPQGFAGWSWHLAFNTAASFVTNTNWQAYSGENTASYFSQMIGLAVQNFLSAAVGMSVAVALFRGLRARRGPELALVGIGNFWTDMVRSVLYILLPLSIIVAIILASQGVVQNLSGYHTMISLEGKADLIPGGPAASQIAIKQLGTNGGGFFGVNSIHPFESPNGISNLVELFSILFIPMAFPFLYGRMLGKPKQGYAVFAAMAILLGLSLAGAIASENVFGTWEGKDLRFGNTVSATWAIATTVTSNGSVNAMIDSMSPLAGGLAMLNLMLGEIIFGGVGSGMYGMIAFALMSIFLIGLMVGRSPEFLNKRIEAKDMQLSMLIIIAPSVAILVFSAISVLLPIALGGRTNAGPHGLSEILYAFSSGAGNNGSAFGGLTVNTPYYNVLIGLDILIGRYAIIFPVLALAGSMANKKIVAESPATFRTDTTMFVGVMVFAVLIIGALTHFPALTLGPILDHALMAIGVHV